MSGPLDFREKTIKEIRLWAWAAAVLPITALASVFFLWAFGFSTWFDKAMVVGETTMFGVAVIWWWWAMYVIKKIVTAWGNTNTSVLEVLSELKAVKGIVQDEIASSQVNTK